MTVANDSTERAALDKVNPNTLPDHLRLIALGSLLQGQIPQVRRNVDMDAEGTDAGNLATLDALVLPGGGRANSIQRATVRAGGVTGELTVVAFGTTPSTGEIGVAPNGNLVTLGTDAITDMDVNYLPERGDVLESTFPVVSDTLTLPDAITARGVVLLLDVEAVEGTVTGRKIVLVPGSAPAAGQAALDVAKATVAFQATDAVTRATVKLLLAPLEDLCDVLEAAASVL
jgi:hypothetical protein